jgi:trehalose 6-phosphate synthase
MPDTDVVVVSNEGPYSFETDEQGRLVRRPAAGGLASSLVPVLADRGVEWFAAATSAGDRAAAFEQDVGGPIRLRLLCFDHDCFARDAGRARSWEAFQRVNETFADALVANAPSDAIVVVHDLRLALVGRFVARRRPDLHLVHFMPALFALPSDGPLVPAGVVHRLVIAMTAYRACGFHSGRPKNAFEARCDQLGVDRPLTFVAPLGPHRPTLEAIATSGPCAAERAALEAAIGDHRLIVSVGRMDPSKNLVRGVLAFDKLLANEPGWRGHVVYLALATPPRRSSPASDRYRRLVEDTVVAVNARWAQPGWTPIVLAVGDNRERSIAALTRYDVLVVNPIRDGLHAVAKEGALVNDRDGVIVLSREACAGADMTAGALGIDPFSISDTSRAMRQALRMPAVERRARAVAVSQSAGLHDAATWLDSVLAAARSPLPAVTTP